MRFSMTAIAIISALIANFATTALAEGNFNWRDPYHQPIKTTNYWGSGDVNLDGAINENDLPPMSEMISKIMAPRSTADINGDTEITKEDKTILKQYLDGNISHLPA